MTNTEKSPQNRPLVTFALFAYNQEKFIREAVDGAFSQTYEPLEIILSDDCSSDRTFEIMQEMAAEYDGPHEVRVRQSEVNLGTLSHVLAAMAEARGDYMVIAAGDDISEASRTTTLIHFMRGNSLDVASSRATKFTVSGDQKVYIGKTDILNTRKEFVFGERISRIHGATAAYKLKCFKNLKIKHRHALLEDTFFELVSHLNSNHVGFLPNCLIEYRIHAGNSSPKLRPLSHRKSELNLCKSKLEASKVFDCFADECHVHERTSEELKQRISKKSQYLKKRSNWYDLSILHRLRLLPIAIQIDGVFGIISRTFGLRFYTILRTIRNIKVT